MQTSIINLVPDARVPVEVSSKVANKLTPQPEAKIEVKSETHEVVRLQEELSRHGISLKYSRDDTTNHLVVQMIDDKTGDAIRQFPTEVSLSLAANFMKLQGVFIDAEK